MPRSVAVLVAVAGAQAMGRKSTSAAKKRQVGIDELALPLLKKPLDQLGKQINVLYSIHEFPDRT